LVGSGTWKTHAILFRNCNSGFFAIPTRAIAVIEVLAMQPRTGEMTGLRKWALIAQQGIG